MSMIKKLEFHFREYNIRHFNKQALGLARVATLLLLHEMLEYRATDFDLILGPCT